jgi:hypothetical protein
MNVTGQDNSILELRKAEIQAMPPGPDKDAAEAAFVRDYEGELAASTLQSDQGFEMANMGQPEGTTTRATYVAANPLEHMAAGLRSFMGNRDMRDARKQQKSLSAAKQEAMMRLLRAGTGGGGGMGLGMGPGMGGGMGPGMGGGMGRY